MLGVGVKGDGVKRVWRELTDGISTIEFETVDIGWTVQEDRWSRAIRTMVIMNWFMVLYSKLSN